MARNIVLQMKARAENKGSLISDYPNFVAEKFEVLTKCYFEIGLSSKSYRTGYDDFIKLLVNEELKSIDAQWLMQLVKEYGLTPHIRLDFIFLPRCYDPLSSYHKLRYRYMCFLML